MVFTLVFQVPPYPQLFFTGDVMQYDVQAYIVKQPETAVPYRTRLKGFTITPTSVSLRNVSFCDPTTIKSGTWSRTGTTVTVTINNNGLVDGQRVYLNVATGTTMRDGTYEVSNVTTNTFQVTSVTSGSATGTVDMYNGILLEVDTFNIISLPVLIPGEGILFENGIYVGLGANTTASNLKG